jgi:hypothetical protein
MIADGATLGEDLIGPMRTASTPQSRLPSGFTHADFQIDFDAGQVTCPGGHTTLIISSGGSGQQAVLARKTSPPVRCGRAAVPARKKGAHYTSSRTITTPWPHDAARRRKRSKMPTTSIVLVSKAACRRWCAGAASVCVDIPGKRKITYGR